MDTPHCSSPFHVRSRHRHRGIVLALSLWVVCLVCASDAWGRAGGGGGGYSGGGSYSSSSYSSSSYSSSSYSSSSYGGGGGGDHLDVFPVAGGLLAVSVAMLCLAGYIRVRGGRLSYVRFVVQPQNNSETRGLGHTRTAGHAGDCEHIKVQGEVLERDPSFAADTFLEDFKSAFVAIQEAWMAQDMAAVRHFVSDGIDEKFAVQFREQQRLGYREHLDEIQVHEARLARFDVTGPFEVLTVEVHASLLEKRVPLESESEDPDRWINRLKKLSSTECVTQQSFTEYWSLVRRRGTQTRQGGGRLLAGSCPNCGSPLQLNRLGSCLACDSLVRSGVHDWVLSEITQFHEWRSRRPAELDLRVLQYREQFDAGFSRQHLEDRAWVIMARLGLADASRDLAPLRKVALPKFTDRYEVPQEAMRTNFSINGLDLVGFVVRDEGHFALLQVDWWRNEKSWESLLVLYRQVGVASNQETALQSAHCPSCGAPEETQSTDACVACGQVTNTGKYGWVLADFIEDGTSPVADDWRRRLRPLFRASSPVDLGPVRSNSSPRRLQPAACFMWAIGELVRAEGFTDAEQRLLARCASRHRIAAAEFAEWVWRAQRGELVSPRHPDVREKLIWLDNLVKLVSPDRTIDTETTTLLMRLSWIVGLPDYDVAYAANKQTYWEAVSRRLSDLGNW